MTRASNCPIAAAYRPATSIGGAGEHAGRRRPGARSGSICANSPRRGTEPDVVVEVEWSGISTGTERLLWSGPCRRSRAWATRWCPGYESVGRVCRRARRPGIDVGERACSSPAPTASARCGLFGGAARRLVVPGAAVVAVEDRLASRRCCWRLATASVSRVRRRQARSHRAPDLIVGHGVLGRLMARLNVAAGNTGTVVWGSTRNAGAGWRAATP